MQALPGIAQISAVTILAELGKVSRFPAPRQLMGYSGIVASEHSSGERHGGAVLPRRAMPIFAAWSWRRPGLIDTDPSRRGVAQALGEAE